MIRLGDLTVESEDTPHGPEIVVKHHNFSFTVMEWEAFAHGAIQLSHSARRRLGVHTRLKKLRDR